MNTTDMMMMMIVSLRFFIHMARARFLLVVLKVTDESTRFSVLSINNSNLSPRWATKSMFLTMIPFSSSTWAWVSITLSRPLFSEWCFSCAAKTLENSLFMAYGSAVCALEPYVVWNLFFISFRKLKARERSKSSSVIQRYTILSWQM